MVLVLKVVYFIYYITHTYNNIYSVRDIEGLGDRGYGEVMVKLW